MTIGQAVKVKKIQAGPSFPDFFVCEPRGGFCGLFIEIKTGLDKVFTCGGKGAMRQTQQIQEQCQMLKQLEQRGYMAVFGCGYDRCKTIINRYLRG